MLTYETTGSDTSSLQRKHSARLARSSEGVDVGGCAWNYICTFKPNFLRMGGVCSAGPMVRGVPSIPSANLLSLTEAATRSDPWAAVVEQASRSMVMLRINQTRAFAGDGAASTIATGFVVDKARGIILTNRHVVTVGPTTGDGVFVVNQEEVIVRPLYRDPVHDFGFFAFDPSAVKFQELVELPLYPQGATIGTEVRVVGSDAGEKIMVLQGVISRVDRDAPEYDGSYQDFDTFYISSASSTSGGSSGSPVLDIQCRCVALNCGGALLASTSFFLPLDRVVVALENIRKGILRPPRGTLQAVFRRLAMDEARRLGLSEDDEIKIRSLRASAQGVMSFDKIVPGGPGALAGIQEGDLLVKVNDTYILDFSTLEDILDNAEAKKSELAFHIQRGGKKLIIPIVPGSLWDALPHEFVEYSGGVFHSIPYQQAVSNSVALDSGVFVANPGFAMGRAGVLPGCVIFQIGSKAVSTLDDFIDALVHLPEKAKVRVRFFHVGRRHIHVQHVLINDREWFIMSRAVLDNATGLWNFTALPSPPLEPVAYRDSAASNASDGTATTDGEIIAASLQPMSPEGVVPPALDIKATAVEEKDVDAEEEEGEETKAVVEVVPVAAAAATPPKHRRSRKLSSSSIKRKGPRKAKTRHPKEFTELEISKEDLFEAVGSRCLVQVIFDVAHPIDGNGQESFEGVGIIVDAENRLILCDRNTCVSRAGDVRIVFNSSFEVTGKVMFSHPLQNFCFVQYDVFDAPDLEIIPVRLKQESLEQMTVRKGDSLLFIGLSQQHHIVTTEATVTSVERANVFTPVPPRFSAKNFDVVNLDQEPSNCLGGFFMDSEFRPRALWSSFSFQDLTEGGDAEEWYATLISPVADALVKVQNHLADPTLPEPVVYSFGIEFERVEISEARQLGLPDEYVKRLSKVVDEIHSGKGGVNEILKIQTLMAGTQPSKVLKTGDLLLTVNGKSLISYYLIDQQAEECGREKKPCAISVLRDGAVIECLVTPIELSLRGTSRILFFAGLQLQETFDSVLFHGFLPDELDWGMNKGVYVSGVIPGSPADKFAITPLCWIMEVDDKPTYNLDAFLQSVCDLKDEQSVRLKVVDLNGVASVASTRLDLHYFATQSMQWNTSTSTWHCEICSWKESKFQK